MSRHKTNRYKIIGGKGKRCNKRSKKQTRRLVITALFALIITASLTTALVLYNLRDESPEAQEDYIENDYPAPVIYTPEPPEPEPEPTPEPELEPDPDDITERAKEMLAINPDFIGWIEIEGTVIEYPVVQGEDNGHYIRRSFTGEDDDAGTIFMDWKNDGAFESFFAVLYGHNLRDGSMFSDLHKYRDEDFLEENPHIIIMTPEGETLIYSIFAVRLAQVTDSLFSLFDKEQNVIERYFAQHGAPESARQFLVLSTCTVGGSEDDRLLIYAALLQ